MRNYYELLEISNSASVEVIRAAYKAKIKLWHPDNFGESSKKESATEMIKQLNRALEVLTDADKRAEYDELLSDFTGDTMRGWQEREGGIDEGLTVEQVQKMIILTKTEKEYLMLHKQIAQSAYSEKNKIFMSEVLDRITKMRLKEEIELAQNLAYSQKEVREQKNAALMIVVIGFILTNWFSSAYLIAIVLAVLSYIGGADDRKELEAARKAEDHVQLYRSHGFRI